MVDWLHDPKEFSDEELAFGNMFYCYLMTPGLEGGLIKFYQKHGVSIVDNEIVFDSPQHRTMFLLRWLS